MAALAAAVVVVVDIPGCGCRKVAYASRADARRSTALASGFCRQVYRCPSTDAWHLSSMTKAQYRAARRRARNRATIHKGES
jgi:hypothetical protein